jgi:hypothetical protein
MLWEKALISKGKDKIDGQRERPGIAKQLLRKRLTKNETKLQVKMIIVLIVIKGSKTS